MHLFKIAIRSLAQSPVFAAVAILTLALGIGANSAIFSIINAVFLRPLPYVQPDRIVALTEQGIAGNALSYPKMLAAREGPHVFSDVTASTPTAFTVNGTGDPEQVQGMIVSQNYFPLLGVQPISGRNFLPEEDRAGAPSVVILSYRYWQEHFAARADVVGQSITLDGEPRTIIGIMPKSLSGFPLAQVALFTTQPQEAPFLTRQQIDGGGAFYAVFARLAPGVDIAQARAAMAVVAASYAQAHPENADAKSLIDVAVLQENLVVGQRQTYAILLGAVAAVLLIACVNVANLVLARFSRRRKDIGIRFALGARRAHIVRQFLAESLAISLTGGLLGLLLAEGIIQLVVRFGKDVIPRADEISLDPAVLIFTLAVSILVGLVLGLIPSLRASAQIVNEALKDSSRNSTGSRSHTRFRNGLLIAEIAASFVLLVATSLLIASFLRVRDIAPGFQADGIFVGFVLAPPSRYPARTEATVNFYAQLYHRLQQIPGAKSVAFSDDPPLSGNETAAPYAVAGRPKVAMAEQPLALRHLISPNRFAVLGIPFKAGRDFSEHDTPTSPAVVIINETMARQLFSGQNPIGQTLQTGMMQLNAEIVGVVADTHTTSLTAPPQPEMFLPILQRPENFTGILIRSDGDPAVLAASVRAALHEVDAGIPLTNTGTMRAFVDQSMADRQLTMTMLIVFAGLALVLASLGVYSVIAYSVTQRSEEVGIRMALGARAGSVQRLFVGEGLRLALIGIGVGIVAALAFMRVMQALLFEVGAREPLIYLGVVGLLCVVAVAASWIPARRAANIDPVQAMRNV